MKSETRWVIDRWLTETETALYDFIDNIGSKWKP